MLLAPEVIPHRGIIRTILVWLTLCTFYQPLRDLLPDPPSSGSRQRFLGTELRGTSPNAKGDTPDHETGCNPYQPSASGLVMTAVSDEHGRPRSENATGVNTFFAKFFTRSRPARITQLQRRIDWLWTKGVITGLFIGLAGLDATAMIGLNGLSIPALVLLVLSVVAVVVLTWRSLRVRNQLAGWLALLDAED